MSNPNGKHKAVLRSRNYLLSAPAPLLSLILAPAPAPAHAAIYCHLKLFYKSSAIPIELEISFSSS